MNESLKKLRAMTEGLPKLEDLVVQSQTQSVIDIATPTGKHVCHGLFKSEHAGIMVCTATAGVIMEQHVHEEREWLGVMSGSMVLHLPTGRLRLDQYEGIDIDPGVAHTIHFPEECKYWTISMPVSKGYASA